MQRFQPLFRWLLLYCSSRKAIALTNDGDEENLRFLLAKSSSLAEKNSNNSKAGRIQQAPGLKPIRFACSTPAWKGRLFHGEGYIVELL